MSSSFCGDGGTEESAAAMNGKLEMLSQVPGTRLLQYSTGKPQNEPVWDGSSLLIACQRGVGRRVSGWNFSLEPEVYCPVPCCSWMFFFVWLPII